MLDWMKEYAAWIVGTSIVMFVATLVAIPILLARIPADYFVRRRGEREIPSRLHPALRIALLVLKNVIGAAFLLAGLIMIITPGQGILSVLIGISLLNIPGKRRLELSIVRRPHVLKAINWIRSKAKRPPLQIPPAKGKKKSDEEPEA